MMRSSLHHLALTTPPSNHTHSPQEGIVAEEEEDSNPAPPLEDIPIGPSIASGEVPTSSPPRGGIYKFDR